MYVDRTLALRIGSAKVKSKREVVQCPSAQFTPQRCVE